MMPPDQFAPLNVSASHATLASRWQGLDALRGAAMVWMTVFHFCFDLRHFGFTQADFYRDPFWTWQRTAIVSLFLLCAGASQAVAAAQQVSWVRFWRRWGQIAGCALLVSLGSWWMFPKSFISFGVLHGMAVMLLLLRLIGPRLNLRLGLVLALLCLLAPQLLSHAFFDSRWTNWVGLVTMKPITEDYVPVLPWLGVMLLGYLASRVWIEQRMDKRATTAAWPRWLTPLANLGRWSLSYYMLHQPVLIGGLMLWQATMRA